MKKDIEISLYDLIMGFSEAIDLISPHVANHHKQVAYIAGMIAEEIGLSIQEKKDLILAGALHDSGAMTVKERLDTLEFDVVNPHTHAEIGYLLFKDFAPLQRVAEYIRFHHVPWRNGAGIQFNGESVPLSSHLLHLADRIAVLIDRKKEILGQASNIMETIQGRSGNQFHPELVKGFCSLASKEYFWIEASSASIDRILEDRFYFPSLTLNLDGILDLTRLFAKIVDFRSQYTFNHSCGVAEVAVALTKLLGFSHTECKKMRIAGYLHDLGKLSVPTEILEKNGKLTEEEYRIIRKHTYFTYRVLEHIEPLHEISIWASYHHERLDGSGYPFHVKLQDFPLPARIMAVADVFTAIMENRPYRKEMSKDQAISVLQKMADSLCLDPDIVSLIIQHFDEINSLRASAQERARTEYNETVMVLE